MGIVAGAAGRCDCSYDLPAMIRNAPPGAHSARPTWNTVPMIGDGGLINRCITCRPARIAAIRRSDESGGADWSEYNARIRARGKCCGPLIRIKLSLWQRLASRVRNVAAQGFAPGGGSAHTGVADLHALTAGGRGTLNRAIRIDYPFQRLHEFECKNGQP
ncbi:hypothetical protein [Burkholderia sp. BCC1998]|uniref:hypothetical protein n=1 Tax=Burkholderia sp. BCC1998 TaxID=2817447 RepID=UPI002AB64A78|nr:hypothetical protein [Burkholderia sp. BCC1998]